MDDSDCEDCREAEVQRKRKEEEATGFYKRLFQHLDKVPDYHDGEVSFESKKVPYLIYARFIQLLPPIHFFLFMRTSKWNYRNCLQFRGLECEYLSFNSPHLGYEMPRDLVRSVFFYCEYFPEKWRPFLAPQINFYINPSNSPNLTFVKKYKTLTVIDKEGIPGNFVKNFKKFVHSGLTWAHVSFSLPCHHEIVGPESMFSREQISAIFDAFKVCTNFKSFSFSTVLTKLEKVSFVDWKELTEEFYGQHKNLKKCELSVGSHHFHIHDNVLKKSFGKSSDYDPETVLHSSPY